MKIGNYTLKGIKNFTDHEGFTIQKGNIYNENKKIGTFEEDVWGGPTRIKITNEDDDLAIRNFAREWLRNNPKGIREANYVFASMPNITIDVLYRGNEVEGFIVQLLKLYNLEQNAKDYFKKGYSVFVDVHTKDDNDFTFGLTDKEQIEDVKKEDDDFVSGNVVRFEMYNKEDFEIA